MIILKDFFLSLQFLTIIPPLPPFTTSPSPYSEGGDKGEVKGGKGGVAHFEENRFGKAAVFFPLVSLLIGGLLVIISKLTSLFLPLSVSDAIVITTLIIITGGLHIDGFADTIDGFAGGKDRDDVLRIMKDSGIGAFGAAGLIMLLLIKYLSIQSLQMDMKYWILAVMPVFGRWAVLPMGLLFRYARLEGGTGKAFAEAIKIKEFVTGTILCLFIVVLLLGVMGFLMLAGIFIVTLIIGWYSKRRIGGITGDVFGAAIEINELMTLILSLVLF
ncbi:MAG: adenosylcobinamide-GDP ribazoletransferase [Nitrospirae bacterium]|nr:adenosylcobinamide-GDP ribazoletransferase [Nitrospirota bacterium]